MNGKEKISVDSDSTSTKAEEASRELASLLEDNEVSELEDLLDRNESTLAKNPEVCTSGEYLEKGNDEVSSKAEQASSELANLLGEIGGGVGEDKSLIECSEPMSVINPERGVSKGSLNKGENELADEVEQANCELATLLGEVDGGGGELESLMELNEVALTKTSEVDYSEDWLNKENSIFAEIDRVAASMFYQLRVVDEGFETIANFFSKVSEQYLNASEKNYGSFGYLSIEGQVAATFAIAELAVRGFRNVISLFQQQSAIVKLMPVLKREAELKLGLVHKQLPIVEEMVVFHIEQLEDKLDYSYRINDDHFWMESTFHSNISDPLKLRLDHLRKTLYHYRLLQFMNAQYSSWLEGSFSEAKLPDYGDINQEILYHFMWNGEYIQSVPEVRYDIEQGYCEFIRNEVNLIHGVKRVGDASEEDNYISANACLLFLDRQLMATYLRFEKSFTFYSKLKVSGGNNFLRSILNDNTAFTSYTEYAVEYSQIENELSMRKAVLNYNAWAFTLVVGACLVNYFNLSIGTLIITGVVGYFAVRRARKMTNQIQEAYAEKLNALSLYVSNTMAKIAGVLPRQERLTDIHEQIAKMVLFFIVGFIIGLLLIPFPGGALLGGLIATAFVGNARKEFTSDGSDYKAINTGNGQKAYILAVVLTVAFIYFAFVA